MQHFSKFRKFFVCPNFSEIILFFIYLNFYSRIGWGNLGTKVQDVKALRSYLDLRSPRSTEFYRHCVLSAPEVSFIYLEMIRLNLKHYIPIEVSKMILLVLNLFVNSEDMNNLIYNNWQAFKGGKIFHDFYLNYFC